MLNQHYLKPILTINTIGKTKFWAGLAAGMLFSLSLIFLYNHYFEITRAIGVGLSENLIEYSEENRAFFKYTNAFIVTVIGFSLTCFIWFKGIQFKNRRKRNKVHLLRNAPMFTFAVFIHVVGRYSSLIPFISYPLLVGQETAFWKEFALFEGYQFNLLFNLLPIVFYLQLWMYIRLVFKRIGWWFLVSTVVVTIWSIVIAVSFEVNTDIVDEAYNAQNKELLQYSR